MDDLDKAARKVQRLFLKRCLEWFEYRLFFSSGKRTKSLHPSLPSSWGSGISSTEQIKVRARKSTILRTTPNRKLLAHVQLPCEQKRESLLGANSPFPSGALSLSLQREKETRGKMIFATRSSSTRQTHLSNEVAAPSASFLLKGY